VKLLSSSHFISASSNNGEYSYRLDDLFKQVLFFEFVKFGFIIQFDIEITGGNLIIKVNQYFGITTQVFTQMVFNET
jgi:hypothetical protein